MLIDEQIILGCIKNNRKSQKELFDKYSSILLALCTRYARNKAEAEDILQEGFVKIFMNIKQFSQKGSFEGWLKRIMINTAISNYHQNIKHYNHQHFEDVEDINYYNEDDEIIEDEYSLDELLKLINELPDGYRIVFNMHVIEGYKHKEISEMLNIDVGTSKSQFSRARTYLQKKLKEYKKETSRVE
ncbi:MAG: hypothetical protein A2046_13375 [Bacteroidetes bacterium GWA2_30_7]|nr:MAG: hypothetical protein A2046_13375 [Bacteroidetes bacterium GWA2_30_7]